MNELQREWIWHMATRQNWAIIFPRPAAARHINNQSGCNANEYAWQFPHAWNISPVFPPSSRRPHHAQITTSNNCPLQRSVPLDARFTSQYIEDAPKMSAILFFLVWLPRYNGIWPNIMFANKNKSISHSIGDAEVFFLREMKKAMNTRDKTMRGVRILMHENE